jgi:PAS domain S-box-containing protein
MYSILKKRFNFFIFVVYASLLLFSFISLISMQKSAIEEYKEQQNTKLSQRITNHLQALILEKQQATLAMAISLAQNGLFAKALLDNDASLVDLEAVSKSFSLDTSFKNVWIQLLDKEGKSFLRSWTQKKGDTLYRIREDIRAILKDQQVRSTISVGKFTISFKSMVPIFYKEELVGVIEIITHFNSIEKRLQELGYESLVLVDKKYKNRLTDSVSNFFIEDYYVANFERNHKLIEMILNKGVAHYINQKYLYHAHDDNTLIMTHIIYNNNQDPIGYFIIHAPTNIDFSVVRNFATLYYMYAVGVFLFFTFLLYILLDKVKIMKYLHSYDYNTKLMVSILSFFILFITLLYFFLDFEKEQRVEEFFAAHTKKSEQVYGLVYSKYKDLATLVYKTKINVPAIKKILQNKDKSVARQNLYKELSPIYRMLKEHNIKQLHFHTPKSESFLRFHRPLKYGDSLLEARESVEYVNRNKIAIDGFEEGKIFNGFRFVFPLYEKTEYLGSVEISFSVLAMMGEFTKNFGNKSELFIKKSVVDKKLMKDELQNYIESPLESFYFEKNTRNSIAYQQNNIKFCIRNPKKLAWLNKKALEGKAFSFTFCDNSEVVTMLPLKNPVTKELVGMFTISSQHHYIGNKEFSSRMIFFTLTLFSGFVVLFIYREFVSKKKIYTANKQLIEAQTIAQMGSWELDFATGHLYWSDEVFRIFGLDEKSFTPSYEAFLELIHPDDKKMVASAYENSLVIKEGYEIEHRLLLPSGELKYVYEYSNTIFDDKGKPLVSQGAVQDITQRVLAEKKLQATIKASNVGLWDFNMEQDVIY